MSVQPRDRVACLSLTAVVCLVTACIMPLQGSAAPLADGFEQSDTHRRTSTTPSGTEYHPVDPFWTEFTPSPDSRIVYVSSSSGHDGNIGLSPVFPVRTIAAGYDLLRDGFPDWLLLKRGDVWVNEALGTWMKSGRSKTHPMLISSYGAGVQRPYLLTGVEHGIQTSTLQFTHHLALIGLHFRAHERIGDESSMGVRWLSSGGDLLIEDCKFEDYNVNIAVQDIPGDGLTDVRIRRSIAVDAYSTDSNAQGGFFMGVNGLLLEECVFDHNGWREGVPGAEPNDFSHNIYIRADCSGVIARGNIIANGSSAGLQARSGGDIRDNVFLRNPVSLRFGGGDQPAEDGVTGTILGNLFQGGNDIDSEHPRGHAITLQNVASADVRFNIIAHDASALPYGHAVYFEGDRENEIGVHNVQLAGNIIYDWRGSLRFKGVPGVHLSGLAVFDNVIQIIRGQGYLTRHHEPFNNSLINYAGNTYFINREHDRWFQIDLQHYSFPQWQLLSWEEDATALEVIFVDPNRSDRSYHLSIGGAGLSNGLMNEVRLQSRATWRPELGAAAIFDYFARGFTPLNLPG